MLHNQITDPAKTLLLPPVLIMLLLVSALLLFNIRWVAAAETTQSLTEGLVNPGYEEKPAWFKDSFLDIREDIAEASAENKRVLLYFYQDGCPYCSKLLKNNFGQAEIAATTQAHFDVLAINMWGDREVTNVDGTETTEKAFAAQQQVQYTPTLLFLDETGQAVLRLNGYYEPEKFRLALDFVAGRHEKQGSIRDYLLKRAQSSASGQANKRTTTAKSPLNSLAGSVAKPIKLADTLAKNKRPLLVLFEHSDCKACDELHHDILKREEVAYSMSNFDVAQIDIQAQDPVQTPQGKQLPMADWAEQLNITIAPSLVFFDRSGTEVFRTEARLKSFHLHGAMDYVISGAYQYQPAFQRFLQHRTEVMQARGFKIDLLK